MSDPTTTNILLSVPTRGSDAGTWDVPVNGNSTAIDGYFGGVQTISVSNANVLLTSPAGISTPSAGPTQAQNAVIKLSGTVTVSLSVVLPLPGYYVIDTNLISVASSAIVIVRTPTFVEFVALPIGQVMHVYNDGTNVRFVNLPAPGTYLDYAGSSAPGWIVSCSKPPFLVCDGSTFNATTYPVLNSILGGNTLPDFRGRNSYYLNGGSGRLTTGGAGIDGNTLLAAGGANGITLTSPTQLPAHTHINTLTDPGHSHLVSGTFTNTPVGGGSVAQPLISTGVFGDSTNIATTGISITNASVGASANIPNATPGIVAGVRMIRAA